MISERLGLYEMQIVAFISLPGRLEQGAQFSLVFDYVE
jgi:hypothetical protein